MLSSPLQPVLTSPLQPVVGGIRRAMGASMPSGALGIWYADQYDSATKAVPNSVTTYDLSTNLLRAPRRAFNTPDGNLYWVRSGATIVDSAVTAPDGSSDATTLAGTGNWYLYPGDVTLPNGTYTVAISAKRNTASDQQFRIGNLATGTFGSCTATAAWQRFTKTFAVASGMAQPIIISIDGTTGADIQICDFELYAGSADLGPSAPDGNLYLGWPKTGWYPTVADNAIDISNNSFGLIQLPSAVSPVGNITAMVVVKKVAAGTANQAFLSKLDGYTTFSAYTEANDKPSNGIGVQAEMDDGSGLWTLLGAGWHVITNNYNGTRREVWLDDSLLFSQAVSDYPTYSLQDLLVGISGGYTRYSGIQINALALYAGLTASQIRQAVRALKAKASANGLTMADARILVAEGDSITAGGSSPTCYPFLYGANASPAVLGANLAVAGSTLASLVSRADDTDAALPQDMSGRTCILSVLVGRNDLVGYSGGTAAWLADLASYCDARRAAGWTVALCTILPSTLSGFNTQRNTANTELRLWATSGSTVPGQHADYIVDFAADATMGPDAAASNATYYSDGTHPTQAGQNLLEPIYRAVIDAI